MLRFAPSPTSDVSIGSLRLAIFNYIVSKQLNEDLLIRIEDINKEKNIQNKDKEILELLSLFSIDYTSVVYQSENLKYHQKIAMKLLMDKKAFSCFCSDEKLDELKDLAKKENKPYIYDGFCGTLSQEAAFTCNAPFSIRIRKPQKSIQFTDLIKGSFDIKASDLDSIILLKRDKTPTYDYACAMDDMIYDISTVIRDEDYLNNTANQIHLRDCLSYEKKVNYVHLPALINAKTNNKMAKEDRINSVKYLIKEGFLPSSLANYLVSLGNNTPEEIFTLEEAISWFKLENISKSAVKFDIEELRLINKKHLQDLDELRLSKLLGFADTDIGKLAKVYLEECCTLTEIKVKIDSIFACKSAFKGQEKEFKVLFTCLKEADFIAYFQDFKDFITKSTSLSGKTLDKNLRYILTQNENGPNLEKIYPFIKNYLGEIIK